MGLLSFFGKNRQDASADDSDYYSRADEEKQMGRSKRGKKNQPVDPVLPEKKRARRRLVGAVALVLAVIVGLPMILDSEPKPLSDDIAIHIPSKDAPPVKAAEPSRPLANDAASLNAGEEVVEPAKPEVVAQPAAPVIAVAPAKPVEQAAPKPVTPPVAKVDTKPTPAAHPPQLDKDRSVEAERARAILEGRVAAADKKVEKPAVKPATTPSSTSSGKVALQVAALSSQEKVDELQKKLQAAGLKSYTQKVSTSSGERIRVRVGPFANEAEAEKARAKLTGMGLSGTLIPA